MDEFSLTVEQVESLVEKNVIIVGDDLRSMVIVLEMISQLLDLEPTLTIGDSNRTFSVIANLDNKDVIEDVFAHRERGGKNTVVVEGRRRAYSELSEFAGKPEAYYEDLTDVIVMVNDDKSIELFINRKLF